MEADGLPFARAGEVARCDDAVLGSVGAASGRADAWEVRPSGACGFAVGVGAAAAGVWTAGRGAGFLAGAEACGTSVDAADADVGDLEAECAAAASMPLEIAVCKRARRTCLVPETSSPRARSSARSWSTRMRVGAGDGVMSARCGRRRESGQRLRCAGAELFKPVDGADVGSDATFENLYKSTNSLTRSLTAKK